MVMIDESNPYQRCQNHHQSFVYVDPNYVQYIAYGIIAHHRCVSWILLQDLDSTRTNIPTIQLRDLPRQIDHVLQSWKAAGQE